MPGAIDWPGLLLWSTNHHDGTKPSEFKMLSEEDKAFIEGAMEEATKHIEDPNQIFKEAIDSMKAPDVGEVMLLTALEVIDRCCDNPDVARNVEKLDGIQTLLDVSSSRGEGVRVRSMEILALVFSNNATIQEAGFKRGGMEMLLGVVRESPVGSDVRSKAFRTLVALVRGVAAYEAALLGEGGAAVIVDCLAIEEGAGLREKAFNFARGLTSEGRLNADDQARIAAAIVPLFACVAEQGIQYRETFALLASELLRASPSRCPPELVAGVRMRLAQVALGKNPDEETERSLLQECLLAAEGITVAAPPPA